MGKRPSELGGSDPLDRTDDLVDDEFVTTSGAFGEGTYTGGMTAADTLTDTPDAYTSDAYAAEYDDTGTISTADEDDGVAAQREEIERTRSELSSTIDAIQEKLSPENLTNQAKEAVRGATVGRAQEAVGNVTDTVQSAVSDVSDSVQHAVQNVTDTTSDWGGGIVDVIRENPIPAALAGIGLGWLFMSMRNRSSQSRQQAQYSSGYSPSRRYAYGSPYVEAQTHYPDQERYYGAEGSYGTANYSGQSSGSQGAMDRVQGKVGDMADQAQSTASNVADKAQDAMSQAQDTAGQVAGQVQDTASQVVNQVQGTAGQVASQAQETAGQVASQAQYGVQRAGSQLDRLMHERPLAVGAGALALGLAVGLAVPETRKEQEWMGETRDSLMDRAQHVVQDTAGKVSTVAEEAVGAAKESAKQAAQEQGLTSGEGQSSSNDTETTSTSSGRTKSNK